jgi:hypothetical protein
MVLGHLLERRYHGDEVAWAFARVVSPLVQRSSDKCISTFTTCAKAFGHLRELFLQGEVGAWTFAGACCILV